MTTAAPVRDAEPDPWFPPPGAVLPNGMPLVISFRVDCTDRLALNLKAGELKEHEIFTRLDRAARAT